MSVSTDGKSSTTHWNGRALRTIKGSVLLCLLALAAIDQHSYEIAAFGFGVGFLCAIYVTWEL